MVTSISRYLSDEYVYKPKDQPHLSQSYDQTMLIEETVEMVDINSELQMVDVSTEQEQVSVEEVSLEQQMEVESQNVEGEAVDGVQANEEVGYLNSPQTPTQDEPVVELEGKECELL